MVLLMVHVVTECWLPVPMETCFCPTDYTATTHGMGLMQPLQPLGFASGLASGLEPTSVGVGRYILSAKRDQDKTNRAEENA